MDAIDPENHHGRVSAGPRVLRCHERPSARPGLSRCVLSTTLLLPVVACGLKYPEGATDGAVASTGEVLTSASATAGAVTSSGDPAELVCEEPSAEVMDCVPRAGTTASWTLDLNIPAGQTVEFSCTVTSVVDNGLMEALSLDCPGVDLGFQLHTANPHTPTQLEAGASISLQLTAVSSPGPLLGYFALRDSATGTLLVAGVDAPITEVSIDPFAILLRRSACDLAHRLCRATQRHAVEVMSGDSTAFVFDGNFIDIAGMRILIDDASPDVCYSTDPDCIPEYPLWSFRALFVRT